LSNNRETIDVIDEVSVTDYVRALKAHLVAVKPALRIEDIEPDSSLTENLGFDSLDLVALASRIREEFPEFDLRVWLAQAFEAESDSVGSMATALAAAGSSSEVPHD
jgi:acyl carrier protein